LKQLVIGFYHSLVKIYNGNSFNTQYVVTTVKTWHIWFMVLYVHVGWGTACSGGVHTDPS